MDRIPCIVPFCKRTAPLEEDVTEIVCGPHARLADKRLLRLLRVNRRRLDRLAVSDVNWPAAEKMIKREERLWEKVKSQAITRAAGFV